MSKSLEFERRLQCRIHADVSLAHVGGTADLVCVVCEHQEAVRLRAEGAGREQGSVTLLPDTYSAMQAVIDAARWIEEDGWTPATRAALMDALTHLLSENVQTAQPEGERG